MEGEANVLLGTRSRGATLPTILIVASLAFLLAFTLAGTATTQIGFASRAAQSRRAEYLAEAAVRKAIADLLAGGSPASVTHLRLSGDPEDAEGMLTFDPQRARKLDIPVSTDNLGSEVATRGHAGCTVPAGAMHLVGTGRVGGVSRSVEAVLHLPPFPYVLASSGTVRAEGGVLIGSLDATGANTQPEDLLPADLASNSRLEDAVILGPSSFVAGDLRSAGGVVLDPTSQVKGETSLYAGQLELPSVDLTAFDPGPAAQQIEETWLPGQRLVGASRTRGDVIVVGDLLLDGALLYVTGNLTIHGGIRGTGLVAVAGSVRVEGGVSLSGHNQAVLLAGGDVSLSGYGPESSSFQGLVYTTGDFRAHDITVVGAFVSNGAAGSVTLQDTRAFFDATAQSLDLGSRRLWFGLDDLETPSVVYCGGQNKPFEFALEVEPYRPYGSGPVLLRVRDPLTGGLRVLGAPRAAVPVLADIAYDYLKATVPLEMKLDRPDDWTPKRLDAWEARQLQNALEDLAGDYLRGELVNRDFDLNRFLSPAGRARLLLWRPL